MLVNLIIAILAIIAIIVNVADFIKNWKEEYVEVTSGTVYLYIGKATKYMCKYPECNVLQSTEDGAMIYVSDLTLKEYFNKVNTRKLF